MIHGTLVRVAYMGIGKKYKAETGEIRSAGNDLPALMMAGQAIGDGQQVLPVFNVKAGCGVQYMSRERMKMLDDGQQVFWF